MRRCALLQSTSPASGSKPILQRLEGSKPAHLDMGHVSPMGPRCVPKRSCTVMPLSCQPAELDWRLSIATAGSLREFTPSIPFDDTWCGVRAGAAARASSHPLSAWTAANRRPARTPLPRTHTSRRRRRATRTWLSPRSSPPSSSRSWPVRVLPARCAETTQTLVSCLAGVTTQPQHCAAGVLPSQCGPRGNHTERRGCG